MQSNLDINAPLIVLALDQGTKNAGVALVRCSPGFTEVLATLTLTSEHEGDDKKDRLERLMDMRLQLAGFLRNNSIPDLLAYEQPFVSLGRSANWDALPMCLGALLTLSVLRGIDVVPIMRGSACVVAGCYPLYKAPAKTEKQKQEKRKLLKTAVLSWSRILLPDLTDEEEDIADALPLGVAAYNAWFKSEKKKQNTIKPLFGKGSRGARLPKSEKVVAK